MASGTAAVLAAGFATRSLRLRCAVLAALGAIAGLGHAPIDWPIATVIAFALFLIAQTVAANRKAATWQAWSFGFGYFAMTLRWIIAPFLVHIAEDGWMAPFAIVLMAGGMAVFWAGAGHIAHRIMPGRAYVLAILIIIAEVARSYVLTGFPWGLLGHVLIETPFAQTAALAGPHVLTAIVVFAAWCLAGILGQMRVAGLVGLGALALLGVTQRAGKAPPVMADAPVVRLIQPNAPQEQKWDPAYSGIFLDRMLEFTSAGDVPDLFVWPEAAIADLLNYAEWALVQISDAARGAPVIVGVNRREDKRYYNSFVLLGRGGLVDRLYDKQHIVPFGEYVPGGELLAKLGINGFAASHGGGFTPGTGDRLIDVPGIGQVRPLICYEGIFAEEIHTNDRPRTLVLITNDAWFGKDAGPFQHLAQARLRAIEQGLPMVRVANTGVSAMIDAKGRLIGAIPLNTAGYLDVALPPALPPTWYSRYGDIPFFVALILAFGGCFGGAN